MPPIVAFIPTGAAGGAGGPLQKFVCKDPCVTSANCPSECARITKTIESPNNVHKPETVFNMKQIGKGARVPRVKLSIVATVSDMEQGLLSEPQNDLEILVCQQLCKAKNDCTLAAEGETVSERKVLKQACRGKLDMFGTMGNTMCVFVAVLGPPASRRWLLGIWRDEHDFDRKRAANTEIDILKISSVQHYPNRHHVFLITYFDENRAEQSVTFRRVDRNRDVWVELLLLLVTMAREERHDLQNSRWNKTAASAPSFTHTASGSEGPKRDKRRR